MAEDLSDFGDLGFGIDDEDLRKKLYGQDFMSPTGGLLGLGTGLGTQAITAEGEAEPIQGPTPEIPFRYTQQELNPRAAAARGTDVRSPRARSPYKIGTQAVQQDWKTMLAQGLGLSDKDMQYALNPDFAGQKYYAINQGSPVAATSRMLIDDPYMRSSSYKLAPPDDWTGTNQEWAIQEQNRIKDEFNQQRSAAYDKATGGMDRLQYQTKYGAPDVPRELESNWQHSAGATGLSDQQSIYRALSQLPPETAQSVLQNMDDDSVMIGLSRLGNNLDPWKGPKAPEDLSDAKSVTRFVRSRGQTDSGLAGAIISGIVMAGMAAMTGGALAGALAPALGGVGAGAVGGAAGGLMTGGLQAAMSGDWDLKNIAMSTGLGAVGGGLAGGLSGLGGGTGLSFQAPGTVGRAMLSTGQAAQLGIGSGIAGIAGGAAGNMPAAGSGVIYDAAGNPIVLASDFNGGTITSMGANDLMTPQAAARFGIGSGTGATSGALNLKDIFGKAKEAWNDPFVQNVAKPAVQGGAEGFNRQSAANAAYDQMQSQMGPQRAAQAGALASGISRNQSGIFGQKLPENPFYDPVEDVLSAQGGAVS